MNYQKIYNDLMDKRLEEVPLSMFFEYHHIIPISLGGSNSNDNKVKLTYREHFIAHYLLFKFCRGEDKQKMGYALHRMHYANNGEQVYRIKNSRKFQNIKEEIYQFIRGENHPSFGKNPFTDEQCADISNRMMGENNPRYGKRPWNYNQTIDDNELLKQMGKRRSEQFKNGSIDTSNFGRKSKQGKKNISDALKGIPKSEEHKKKISDSLKGIPKSEETKTKMSIARKGKIQKRIQCPYCNMWGGTTMYRWHFDNCKYKEKE